MALSSKFILASKHTTGGKGKGRGEGRRGEGGGGGGGGGRREEQGGTGRLGEEGGEKGERDGLGAVHLIYRSSYHIITIV